MSRRRIAKPSELAQRITSVLREAPDALRQSPSVFRRIPRAAWICALIACLNAVCWSLITPPFQTPDEPAHFAYVQQIAETGRLPSSSGVDYSEEEQVARRDLRQLGVRWHPENHPVETRAQQRHLEADLAEPLDRVGSGGAGVAAAEPPLYYALQTIPYFLGSSGTLLDRLELMRLLSALMAGVTALFAYLFARETLPGATWAWVIGGLSVALAPLLGSTSGAVNPDAMLLAVSAATFYLLARAFRRGLTLGLAVAIGVVTAIGLLTKVNFVGLVPGVVIGLVALSVRAARTSGRAAYRYLALSLAIPASPVFLYIVINLFSSHPGLGVLSNGIDLTGTHGSLPSEVSYIWQFYLPRLPGMANDFPGIFTTRQLWFDRSVGWYGWVDTPFSGWVVNLALVPAALLALLCARELIAVSATLRRRLVELGVYALMGLGALLLVGADSYAHFPQEVASYSQPRYLLLMLPLLGALLALGARGAGRRWGPTVGTLIVILFLAHDVFSQLQVVSRFYG
jgi:4-amino-4-deoxy-L-arabinose transferase-like glycosyltransferase